MRCNLCPRRCNVDRSVSHGFCGVGDECRIARVALHMWEEPFISGERGSGTIFFCGCNLRCFFCQNYEISACASPECSVSADADKLAGYMLKLEEAGAHNINFVTPTPHVPVIADAVRTARSMGLMIPIAYNTNSYVEVQALRMLDGLTDIYMPDYKYVTGALAKFISGAEDYPEKALCAIKEMYRQVGDAVYDENGMMKRGMVIRHLVLPGNVDETRRVLDSVAENFPLTVPLSLMSQYFPAHKALPVPPFDRKLLPREYRRAVDYAASLGFSNILTQKTTSADDSFVPEWGVMI